jgi:arginyl-tRNA synthetase
MLRRKDWIIYVTDHAQKLHFQQLFKVAEAAEWLVGGVRVNHVHFGLVKGEDGKKLASRDGAPVALLDLLNDALHAGTLPVILVM